MATLVAVEQQHLEVADLVGAAWAKLLQAQLSTPHQAELGIQLLELLEAVEVIDPAEVEGVRVLHQV
jgi:hypothetical protein